MKSNWCCRRSSELGFDKAKTSLYDFRCYSSYFSFLALSDIKSIPWKGSQTLKTQRISPFLSKDLEEAAADVVSLIWAKLTPYQTVTLHLTFDDEKTPSDMPAIVLSRLPGASWLLETPLIALYTKSESVGPLVFRGWDSNKAGHYGKCAFGPVKPLWEPNEENLVSAVVSAIEDLFFCVPYSTVPRILIGDPEGELVNYLGRKLESLLSKHSGVLSTLPPKAYEASSMVLGQVKKLRKQIEQSEREAEQEGMQFYTALGYRGFPQFLFLVKETRSSSTVYVWNGYEFSKCSDVQIINSIISNEARKGSVTTKRTPAAVVKFGWPEAIKKLGLEFEIEDNGDEDD